MELSAIIESDDIQIKRMNKGENELENSGDSGLASATDNSLEAGKKNEISTKCLIIEFEALNANERAPIESTFLTKTKGNNGPCNISAIEGSNRNRETINSEGQYNIDRKKVFYLRM